MTVRRLIIGLGNRSRGDDAAGLIAARKLRHRVTPDVSVVEMDDDLLSLMEVWEAAGEVIIIDAVLSASPSGTIHRFDVGTRPIPEPFFRISTHTLNLASVIALARTLDRLPPRLLLYGIEGKTFETGSGLSPDVETAVDIVVGELATG